MVREDVASQSYRHWPVFTTALLSLAFTLVVWFAARNAEQRHIRRMAAFAAQAIQQDLAVDTESWVQDLVQMAKLWDAERGPSYEEWKANAELYLRHHPGCLALERIQGEDGGNWLVLDPRSTANLAEFAEMKHEFLHRVSEAGIPMLGRIRENGDEYREVIAAPILHDNKVQGFVVAFVDVQKWFRDMLRDVAPLGYSIAVREGNTEILDLPGNSPPNNWQQSGRVPFAGVNWVLSVWPKPAVLAEMESQLPAAALLGCLLLGLLSTLAVHFAQQSLVKSSRLQAVNQRLAGAAEEQRAVQTALHSAQARLSAVLENSVDAVISLDSRLRITLFNHAAEEMFGYEQNEVLGQPLDILIPRRFREMHSQHVARFDASPERNLKMSNRKPVFGLRRDGTEFPIDAPLTRLEIDGEKVFNVIIRDITERVRNQEQLLESRNQLEQRVQERTAELQELSNRMAQLQDEDRRRIARELHDGTTQILIALNVDLGAIGRALRDGDPAVRQLLDDSRELVRQCLEELRTVSYLLHPPLLDELGLDLALRNYVKGFSARSEIEINMQLPPCLGALPREIQLATFRILQEALTNIHRHSESRTASILVNQEPGQLRMEIADQGRGIPPEILDNTDGSLGIGIASMRERVRQLGGTFHIESMAGTVIRVCLPVGDESGAVSPQNALRAGATQGSSENSTSVPGGK